MSASRVVAAGEGGWADQVDGETAGLVAAIVVSALRRAYDGGVVAVPHLILEAADTLAIAAARRSLVPAPVSRPGQYVVAEEGVDYGRPDPGVRTGSTRSIVSAVSAPPSSKARSDRFSG